MVGTIIHLRSTGFLSANNNNIPVLLGEFGAIKFCEYNSRMLHYATVTEQALSHGFAFSAWDDGDDFYIYKRESREWTELKDIDPKFRHMAPFPSVIPLLPILISSDIVSEDIISAKSRMSPATVLSPSSF